MLKHLSIPRNSQNVLGIIPGEGVETLKNVLLISLLQDYRVIYNTPQSNYNPPKPYSNY